MAFSQRSRFNSSLAMVVASERLRGWLAIVG